MEDNNIVMFSFDDLNILSAVGRDVILRGQTEFYDKDSECVIVMSRREFNKALTVWLDEKKGYYERMKYFCGVGYVECKKIKELGETKILNLETLSEDVTEYKEVKIYRCVFDFVQMEHG